MRQSYIDELLTSIRHGNIDEIREWIRSGKVLRWQPRKNALNEAVKTGFFSMVQMLLETLNWDLDELGKAMLLALFKRRVDLVYLLLENGAPPQYADFYDVFGCMDHGLMELFLGYGLDPCNDFAFARILEDTRARPLLWFYKTYRKRYPGLDDQIAMALAYAVKNRNLRWSILLLWAGADPYRVAPEEMDSGKDSYVPMSSAATAAVYTGDLDLIRNLKLQLNPKLKGLLLYRTSWNHDLNAFRKVLSEMSVAELNSGENGGCDTLRETLDWLPYAGFFSLYDQEVEERKLVETIGLLLRAGAKWMPGEDVRTTRRVMIKRMDKHVAQIVELFLGTPGSCRIDDLYELCRTGTIRAKLDHIEPTLWRKISTLVSERTAAHQTTS